MQGVDEMETQREGKITLRITSIEDISASEVGARKMVAPRERLDMSQTVVPDASEPAPAR